MTRTMILILKNVDFGREDLLALTYFFLEVEDKVIETPTPKRVFIGFPNGLK